MTHTVGHANTHNSIRAVRVLRRHGCDSIGLNEVNRLTETLVKLRGYRLLVGGDGARDPHKARSNALLVRKGLPLWGRFHLQASERVPGVERIAPDRWIVAALIDTPDDGKIAHLSVHPNAGVRGHDLSLTRVRGYVEYMRTLDRLLDLVDAEGFAPVVTGDFNLPSTETQKFLTPYRLFDQRGMTVRSVGIDGVALDKRLQLAGDVVVIDKDRLGSDHPGIVAPIARRP